MKIILFATAIAICQLATAQVSKDAFEKAVDYVNCKAIELSLKGSQTQGVTAQFQSKCHCGSNSDFNTIKTSIPETEKKTIELSSEIDKIKSNEFKPNLKTEEVIKILTEDIFTNQKKYQQLFAFADKRKKDSDFSDLKIQLKNDLQTQLSTKQEIPVNTQPKIDLESQIQKLKDRISDLEQKVNSNEESKGWFDGIAFRIALASLLIIIVVLVLLKFFRRRANDEDIPNNLKQYVKDKINKIQFNANTGMSDFEARNLKNEIEKLKTEVKQLSSKIESSKIPFEITTPKYEQPPFQEIKQPEIKSYSEVLYLSTPNTDGSFNESSAQPTYREGASIYKFTKTASSKAEFQIDEREASIKLALQYPDKNIDPVCDAQNAFNPKAKRIVTIPGGVGEVELVGDKWKLNRKAKIRYEN